MNAMIVVVPNEGPRSQATYDRVIKDVVRINDIGLKSCCSLMHEIAIARIARFADPSPGSVSDFHIRRQSRSVSGDTGNAEPKRMAAVS